MARGPMGNTNKSPQWKKTYKGQLDKLRERQKTRLLRSVVIVAVALFALVLGVLASEVMAQNPDTGDAALALDIRAGTTGDVFEDSQREFRFLFAVLMPITERFTVTAKMERRRLDLRQYQDDGLWKFESESTFWEVGCKIYIGSSDKTR